MKPSVPLQFLVGLIRLIAVYFGLRSLDQSFGTLMSYSIQRAMAPEFAQKMPGVLAIYLPILAFYLALVVAVWVSAPSIGRLALRGRSLEKDLMTPDVCWNEVMIFLMGTLFLGWGLTRLGDAIVPFLRVSVRNAPREMTYTDELSFFIAAVFIGFGGVMMARFPSIYRWMQKRSKALAEETL